MTGFAYMTTFKSVVHTLLDGVPRTSRAQGIFDVFLITLILGNVLAVILGTVQAFNSQYGMLLSGFELFSVSIFSVELLLRLWVSNISPHGSGNASRLQFWKNPFNLLDIISILPFYLGTLVSMDLRVLRLLRIFRVFKISPYFRSLSLLGSVIRQELRPMLSALAVIAILMLFAGSGIYLLERDGQPDTFGDLPSALWWVVVTLSTVGYGDAIPATGLGKSLGAVIMILGVGMVALPAGMLASRFSQIMHRNQDLFRHFVEEKIALDGNVPEDFIERHRLELYISRNEAKSVITNCIAESQRKVNFCPDCGSKLPT